MLGQLLAARWQSPWWVKALLLLLSLATAPLTLAGNALNGAVIGGRLELEHVDFLHLVAFVIPGACVVMVAVITSTTIGQRATLAQRATRRRSTGDVASAEQAVWQALEEQATNALDKRSAIA